MVQELKILTSLCGKYNYASAREYASLGGFQGLKKALEMKPEDIIKEVTVSKLVGRGGAAYPTGKKWDIISNIDKTPKYIVCNADEGEPGTFKDRKLIYNDPMRILEGMAIAAYAINSEKGYIYIRGEYREGYYRLKEAVRSAKAAGYLGENILGSNLNFDIEVVSGAGAYVCGENSALCESIEGKSGRPRIKPPYIKNVGVFGQPTLVNNVESFACIPYIIEKGGEHYASIGTETSTGTKLVSICGNVNRPGVYEVPFGITLREIIYNLAGGIEGNRALKFVQMGGASGACFTEKAIDTPLDYKALKGKGISIGSGAIVVADQTNCPVDFALMTTEFFLHESCGKCTPCREGNAQIHRMLKDLSSGYGTEKQVKQMENIANVMMKASFCGLGQTAPTALLTLLNNFRQEFIEHINGYCRTGSCNIARKEAAI
jgi:NADH-quinone oxidoreductase subunit F